MQIFAELDYDFLQFIHHQNQSLRFIKSTSYELYERSYLVETRRIFESYISDKYIVTPICMSIIEMRAIRPEQIFQECVDQIETDLCFCELMMGVSGYFEL